MEVYRHPVNRFVAGFVGTPPMNFLTGRIVRDGDRLLFVDDGNRLALTPEQQRRLAGFVDQPLTMGVRPEAVRPERDAPPDSTLRLTVSVVEPLGDRMDVHAQVGSHPFVCRIDADQPIREGQTVDARVDMSRVHFFEPGAEGRNMSLPPEAQPDEA